MVPVTLYLEEFLMDFYGNIARSAGVSVEQVLQDALFKLAGELSLEAMQAMPPYS